MQTKKLYFLLITLCVMNSSKVFSQAPDIQWEKTFGGSKDDELRVVRQTADGGYFIGGTSESPASGDKTQNAWADSDDFWILKTNSSGAIEWQHTIGGNSIDDFKSVEQTADGGYLLAGRSQSKVSGDKTVDTKGGADNWIMKLNSSGIIEWQQSIGSKDTDATTAMQQTSDGGYIIGSSSYGPDSKDKTEECFGGYDYWIIKLDNAGGIEWDNTIGGTLNDNLAAIEQTSDGGYILGGVSYSPLSVDKTEASVGGADYWIVKLDASGNIEWQNTIGGTGNDYLYTTQQTADGGYIIGGESLSGISGDKTELGLDQDYWVLKLTAAGAIEWQNTIGASGDDSFRDIWQTADGNYILAGYSGGFPSGDKTEPQQGGQDYWIVKIDGEGTVLWDKTIGGDNADYLYSIQETSNGGYVLGGVSYSGTSGDKTGASQGGVDYWVVKLFGCEGLVYADTDEDGYGDAANSLVIVDCIVPEGYVLNQDDCNDSNGGVSPGALETGNGIDDNCNGIVDDVICLPPVGLKTKDLTATTVKLKWSPNFAASGYQLRYKEGSTGAWTQLSPNGKSKDIEGLSPATKYVWQMKSVCGINPKFTSDWSEKHFFTTSPLKISANAGEVNSLEIYPNPASEHTTIHFYLTQPSQVNVKIVDVNGKEMTFPGLPGKTLLNEIVDAGDHSLLINTAGFAKGIYFVRMITENGIQNQKLIVQ